ncbi:MAG: DUF975 family protein [Ruminococcaceae bacterium]|nr:DUF975 family protein [Oscillospiraceae bacterium]
MLYARDFRQTARERLAGCWTTAVICALVYGVICGALQATMVGLILLGGPLWFGYFSFWLAQVRGQRPGIGVLFEGLQKCFGCSIAVYLLQSIFVCLWGLLFVIPGIVKSYSYAMTPYILADHPDMDPLEVINTSREMMVGNKWRLFCLDMSFIGWSFLCLLTLGIGSFWLAPYTQCARAAFYEDIRRDYEEETAESV